MEILLVVGFIFLLWQLGMPFLKGVERCLRRADGDPLILAGTVALLFIPVGWLLFIIVGMSNTD